MEEMYEYNPRKFRKDLEDKFGEHFDLFINTILTQVPVILDSVHDMKSESELNHALRQLFRRLFAVDVTTQHRKAFRFATRETWQVLQNLKKDAKHRPSKRRGLVSRAASLILRLAVVRNLTF